jgi:hypothetical protein
MCRLALTKHSVAGVITGVFTFVATHLMLMAKWTSWFHGQYEPWFLNTTSAGEFTLACFFVVSLIAGLFNVFGWFIWLGAVVAMVVVLCVPPGPGTLWPIAIAFGGFLLATAILFGSALGLGIRYVIRRLKYRMRATTAP